KMAKEIFDESFETGKLPRVIVEEKGLVQITDEAALAKIVDQIIAENPRAVEDFKKGQERVIGFLVGQVMRLTQGKANPDIVNKLLREKLR
ncbi:MAG: Asp-tRNA(Asn)/Glu-tRNA(Gln) amidotransferase GatCAB subunit B, partial [Actinomycetota bacterium]